MEEKKEVEQVLRRWRLRLNLSSYLEPQLLAYSSLYWRNMCVIITQSTLIFRRPTLEIKLKILFISGCWLSRGLGGRLPRKHWLLALRHVSAHPLGHCQQPLSVSGRRQRLTFRFRNFSVSRLLPICGGFQFRKMVSECS